MRKSKRQIIEDLRAKGVEFNPGAPREELEALLDAGKEEPEKVSEDTTQGEQILAVVQNMSKALGSFNRRLDRLEGKQSLEYRDEARDEDIEKADETKDNVDPRIVAIVEESLGTDFGIEIEQNKDAPGFLFTLIVPQRLSDNTMDSRPMIDKETGGYKKDENKNIIYEQYFPQDRRSRQIGSMQSYEAIKEHCDRVRAYIVSYYQKMKQPLPEFRVK